MLLLIGFPEDEIELLRKSLKDDILAISEEQSDMVLEDIIKGGEKSYRRFGEQRIVIMHNVPKEAIGGKIRELRGIIKEHTIFATTTPVSLKWQLYRLVEELLAEDKYFRSK